MDEVKKQDAVCAKCVHVFLDGTKTSIGSYFCHHPEAERKDTVPHHITGEPVFLTREGHKSHNQFPPCDSINKDGNCGWYEEKPVE